MKSKTVEATFTWLHIPLSFITVFTEVTHELHWQRVNINNSFLMIQNNFFFFHSEMMQFDEAIVFQPVTLWRKTNSKYRKKQKDVNIPASLFHRNIWLFLFPIPKQHCLQRDACSTMHNVWAKVPSVLCLKCTLSDQQNVWDLSSEASISLSLQVLNYVPNSQEVIHISTDDIFLKVFWPRKQHK